MDFAAKVTPNDATNPYYEVTSSDPDTIEVIKTVGTDGPHYALKGHKAGVANITVTSKGRTNKGETVSKTTEIKVLDSIYFEDLNTLIDDAKESTKYPNLYVAASFCTTPSPFTSTSPSPVVSIVSVYAFTPFNSGSSSAAKAGNRLTVSIITIRKNAAHRFHVLIIFFTIPFRTEFRYNFNL